MIDRDIAVIDLVSLEEAKDVQFPLPAICLIDPFLEKRFAMVNTKLDVREYLNYLKGNGQSDLDEMNDFENITMDLKNYFLYAKESWKNNTDNAADISMTIDHENTFTGFNARGWFMKCFSLKADLSNHRYIKRINLYYNKTKILLDWKGFWNTKGRFAVKLHDKGQFLIGDEPYYDIKYAIGSGWKWDLYDFVITDLEVIQGRNSKNKKCSYDFSSYDKLMLQNMYLKKVAELPTSLTVLMFLYVTVRKKLNTQNFLMEKLKQLTLLNLAIGFHEF